MAGPTPRQRVRSLASSFEELDAGLVGGDPLRFPGYREQVRNAREGAHEPEACLWGIADVDGVRCALVVMDFGFLGGSMGAAVGEKVARAFDAARRRRLPVVTVTASGGARMQEGMVSLVQMAKTAEARRRHAVAGLGHACVLTSPTTGGVYASFASLADVTLAEPGATVGFAGPRVIAELTGAEPPPDVHTAEFALEHGLLDALVEPRAQRRVLGRVLRNLSAVPGPPKRPAAPVPRGDVEREPWERVRMARDPARPKGRAVVEALLSDTFELRGDRLGGGDDPGVVAMLGSLRTSGVRVIAVAQDASGDGRIRPPGFRKAVRSIGLAGRLGLPLMTVIDTRGADPLPESEAGGVASAVAQTFLATLACLSPSLAIVTGEGGSGGALAMAPCDRVLVWENAFFSVIAPEGAAVILHRDSSRAPELAQRLRLTARDLVELRIADEVVPEPRGGAQASPDRALRHLAAVAGDRLDELLAMRKPSRLAARRRRWRRTGVR